MVQYSFDPKRIKSKKNKTNKKTSCRFLVRSADLSHWTQSQAELQTLPTIFGIKLNNNWTLCVWIGRRIAHNIIQYFIPCKRVLFFASMVAFFGVLSVAFIVLLSAETVLSLCILFWNNPIHVYSIDEFNVSELDRASANAFDFFHIGL